MLHAEVTTTQHLTAPLYFPLPDVGRRQLQMFRCICRSLSQAFQDRRPYVLSLKGSRVGGVAKDLHLLLARLGQLCTLAVSCCCRWPTLCQGAGLALLPGRCCCSPKRPLLWTASCELPPRTVRKAGPGGDCQPSCLWLSLEVGGQHSPRASSVADGRMGPQSHPTGRHLKVPDQPRRRRPTLPSEPGSGPCPACLVCLLLSLGAAYVVSASTLSSRPPRERVTGQEGI